jgi:ELWxxDGT repeat protein
MNAISRFLISIAFTFSCGLLNAQATVLQNYYTVLTNGSYPKEFTEYNGYLYFSAATDETGRELWRTDGTAAGTQLFMDIGEYSKEGNPRNLTLFNSMIFFVANDGINGDQIWKTDGTTEGTVMVTNLDRADPTDLIVCNGAIYFSGVSEGFGRELWKTDGTTSGTALVKDIYSGSGSSIIPGSSSSGPFFAVFNNKLYFYATDGINGFELWESDGTAAGTNLLLDIYPGSVSSVGNKKMVVFNGELYFAANSPSNGIELWKSDGTVAGTQLLQDIHLTASSNPSELTVSGGILYFSADDGINGTELWHTDGTQSGTVLVKDLEAGASGSGPVHLFDFNGSLIFNASALGSGYELYKSDGTVSGTGIIKDIRPGVNSGNPKGFVLFNSQVYFQAASNLDIQLWRTDGTSLGTVQVESITNGIEDESRVFNNELFFVANDIGAFNFELWHTDGTNGGTSMVRDIYSNTSGSEITDWTIFNDKLLFGPLNTTYGKELFQSDGTTSGTALLKDIYAGANNHGIPKNFVKMGSNAYFFAYNSSTTYPKLHRTDGTNAGTVAISGQYNVTKLSFALGNNLCFFVTALPNDLLYKTDGTSSPVLVASLSSSSSLCYPEANYAIINDVLYFVTNHFGGRALWRTDGTAAGTYQLMDFVTNNNAGSPNNLINLNGVLYFTAGDVANGRELWKSDGTTAGTVMVSDIYPGSGSSSPIDLAVSGGKVYFSAFHPSYGRELWESDGTVAGTVLVSDLEPGIASSNPLHMTTGPNCIWYTAFNQTSGRELWQKTNNGIPEIVSDIFPGSPSSNPANLKVIDGELYFGATNGSSGAEPYKTLGSTCSTSLIEDLNPGDVGSYPEFFGRVNNKILFYATTPFYGKELMSVDAQVQIIDNAEACSFYVWGSTGDTLLSSGFYSGIVQNQSGCDSLVHLQLIIHGPDSIIDIQTACTSYLWIDGNTYVASTNTPTVILQNTFGCDSIVTLNLTILSDSVTDIQVACDSLTWIDGITYTSSTNVPTFLLQNAAGCDSTITLNLTILNSSSATETQTSCDSFIWPINGQTYITSGQYIDTIPNAAGCDSIISLDLTIMSALPLTIGNTFSIPSDANSCTGEVAVSLSGNVDFELDFDNGSQVVTSSGYSLVTNLCPGVHDLHVTDNCGDTLSVLVVIPIDSNFVFNNPFIDSLAQDSLGVTLTNCDIFYNGIDTAYIDSIWATGNTVNVIWNIVDSNGSNFDTTIYVLNNGNGVYWLQLSVFCPNKSLGEYFTVTEAIYFNNGTVSTAGTTNYKEALFEIYPNPTNDQVHINFSGSDAELTVYDLQGKVVLKDRIQNQGIVSLQNFERGVYLFDFKNSQGHSVQRVVKQ